MNFVIDSNILISALIKDSTTRKVLIEAKWNFYYPELAFHEIRKYKELILEKSGMDEEAYLKVLSILLKHIILVPEEQFLPYLKEAEKIMSKIDVNDVIFLALAMSIPNAKIISNDPHLKMQERIQTFQIKEIIDLL